MFAVSNQATGTCNPGIARMLSTNIRPKAELINTRFTPKIVLQQVPSGLSERACNIGYSSAVATDAFLTPIFFLTTKSYRKNCINLLNNG